MPTATPASSPVLQSATDPAALLTQANDRVEFENALQSAMDDCNVVESAEAGATSDGPADPGASTNYGQSKSKAGLDGVKNSEEQEEKTSSPLSMAIVSTAPSSASPLAVLVLSADSPGSRSEMAVSDSNSVESANDTQPSHGIVETCFPACSGSAPIGGAMNAPMLELGAQEDPAASTSQLGENIAAHLAGAVAQEQVCSGVPTKVLNYKEQNTPATPQGSAKQEKTNDSTGQTNVAPGSASALTDNKTSEMTVASKEETRSLRRHDAARAVQTTVSVQVEKDKAVLPQHGQDQRAVEPASAVRVKFRGDLPPISREQPKDDLSQIAEGVISPSTQETGQEKAKAKTDWEDITERTQTPSPARSTSPNAEVPKIAVSAVHAGTSSAAREPESSPETRPASTDRLVAARELPTTSGAIANITRLTDRGRESEMRIAMRTPELGSVEVRASVHDSQVGLLIVSDRKDLHLIFGPEIPSLQIDLHRNHLQLDSVNFFASTTGAGAGFSEGNGNQRFSQQSRAFVPRGLPSSAGEEVEPTMTLERPSSGLNVCA